MLLRRRRLSIRPRRCLGRSNLGLSCIFVFRRWRFDAADFVLCGLAAARGYRTVTECRRCQHCALVSYRSLALSFLVSWAWTPSCRRPPRFDSPRLTCGKSVLVPFVAFDIVLFKGACELFSPNFAKYLAQVITWKLSWAP